MKTAIFLLGLLLLGSVSANKKGGHDRPDHRPHPPIEHDPVKRCIKKDNCLSHGWHSVCAKDVLTGNVGAFPNRCYMHCANKALGVHWEALYTYKTSRHCIRHWLTDPACSTCTVTPPEPEHRPGHGGKGGKGGKH
ncbi:hypothetical protein COHA_007912 [Chlorella ohadii]|uniref:Uncharacterized protein n=1 Tax=Chlorella ohadii TaxID=2649997 RepID=A0AAD5DKZ9_9CHLO|nr:hypothetical protein COHA_007912 [Chlorella ohadii]